MKENIIISLISAAWIKHNKTKLFYSRRLQHNWIISSENTVATAQSI